MISVKMLSADVNHRAKFLTELEEAMNEGWEPEWFTYQCDGYGFKIIMHKGK